MSKENASWPLIDVLAEAAASIFHNQVIREVKKRKIESANMAKTVALVAPVNTSLDPSKVVRYLRVSKQSPKIRTLKDTVPISVDKIVEEDEGKMFSSSNNKIPTAAKLYAAYPQDKRKSYKAVADFFYVLFALVKNGWLCGDDYLAAKKLFSSVHPDYEAIIVNVPKLLNVDFSSLKLPRHDYMSQVQIEPRRVWLLAACAVHYNLDFGLCIRYLDGEYTAKWRDVESILGAVKGLVSHTDLDHMRRILDSGCPANFNWEESTENKEVFISRGNNPSVDKNVEIVKKTMNDEERKSHVLPFPRWVARASPLGRCTPQTIIPGKVNNVTGVKKKSRLCWDGTTKVNWWEITMNEITPMEQEALITFGYVYMAFCIWIYNLRITFPKDDILLAFIDISSCFCWPRIHPDLAGAFGFMIGPLFYVANAMVFGSVASATSWEPFRRAIAAPALSYFGSHHLKTKHKKYLDMVKWAEEPEVSVVFCPSSKLSEEQRCDQQRWIRETISTQHIC